MLTELQAISNHIEEIKKQVQYYNNAFQTCKEMDAASQLDFYKKSLVRLLQLQCDLTAQQVLLELKMTPTTTQALDIIGADYIVHNGQIFISE